MKKLTLTCFFALTGILSFNAQDQLFKRDNSKELVKILEVSPETIKYKQSGNLNGPVHVISKKEVALIIYENGEHEVIKEAEPEKPQSFNQEPPETYYRPMRVQRGMSREDSSLYYKYSQNISINFMSLVNMEVALMYQKDFTRNNLSINIPVAFGFETPIITQGAYFTNNKGYYGNNYTATSSYSLNNKIFDVGIGLNYYPSFRYPVNYYIGPMFKYMQYSGTQTYRIDYHQYNVPTIEMRKHSILTRYCYSITNGFVFRTRSRLLFNIYASLGIKKDEVNETIIDPLTNTKTDPLFNAVNIYFWGGFNIGYAF